MPAISRSRAGNPAAISESMASDAALHPVLARAATWFRDPVAIVLGGSHASGEAVWIETPGGPVCLSDIDLYAVFADETKRRESAGRATDGLNELEHELGTWGFLAPLELGLHTLDEWSRLPARPATISLRRHGRLIAGDPSVRERLPSWTARDVPEEEALLLLENRAFELLEARWPARDSGPNAGLVSRHATYKTALDLALVCGLRHGSWEASADERVRAASGHWRGPAAEPPWDAALAWRRGVVPADAEFERDWWGTARAWLQLWREGFEPPGPPLELEALASRAARRARWRRRVRLALWPEPRLGRRAPAAARLRFAAAGTPQHRLNASAGAFLSALVEAEDAPGRRHEIHRLLERALARLGAVPAGLEPRDTVRALVETWRRWILEAPRSTGAGA